MFFCGSNLGVGGAGSVGGVGAGVGSGAGGAGVMAATVKEAPLFTRSASVFVPDNLPPSFGS